MFCDLLIPVSSGSTRFMDVQKRLEVLVQYGYDVAALNHTVTGKVTPKDANSIKFVDLAADAVNPLTKGTLAVNHRKNLKQLSRLTLVLEGGNLNMSVAGPVIASYDLIAVQPTTEKAFQNICGHFDADLISLDLSARMSFKIKPGPVNLAISRGMYFEIRYSPAIRDQNARRNLIANALALVRATKGRNLIFSSEALQALDVRGPHDVVNLGTIFGLNQALGKAAVSTNCRAVLLHAETRKSTHKGVLSSEPAPAPGKSNPLSIDYVEEKNPSQKRKGSRAEMKEDPRGGSKRPRLDGAVSEEDGSSEEEQGDAEGPGHPAKETDDSKPFDNSDFIAF